MMSTAAHLKMKRNISKLNSYNKNKRRKNKNSFKHNENNKEKNCKKRMNKMISSLSQK